MVWLRMVWLRMVWLRMVWLRMVWLPLLQQLRIMVNGLPPGLRRSRRLQGRAVQGVVRLILPASQERCVLGRFRFLFISGEFPSTISVVGGLDLGRHVASAGR